MQTQCPKCETQFRITDDQLKAAEGQVRCSLCDEVFKALTIDEDLNNSDTEQGIKLPEINSDFEKTPDSEQETASLTDTDADVIQGSDSGNVVELEINSNEDDPFENEKFSDQYPDETTDINDEDSDEFNNENVGTDTPNLNELDIDISKQDNDKEEIYLNEQDSISSSDVIVDNNNEIEINNNNDNQEHLDLFQDDNNQDSPQIIPDELRNGVASNDINIGENLAWAGGLLLLSATLVIQYLWLNRDQFVESPRFQTLADNTCLKFDCSKITIRDPAQIELLTRNVFSHPDEKNALMINIALQNNAKFSQPYPVLQINFSDIRGDAVVARRFTPAEYLAEYSTETERQNNALLPPGTGANFNLEIEDPGKQAITYEFNFL